MRNLTIALLRAPSVQRVVEVFSLRQPFLAPWSAMVTVHATVYRSFTRGAQTVGASVLGIGLSYIVLFVSLARSHTRRWS